MIRLLLRGLVGGAIGALGLPGIVMLTGYGLTDVSRDVLLDLALAMLMPGFAIGFFGGFLPGLRRRGKSQSAR